MNGCFWTKPAALLKIIPLQEFSCKDCELFAEIVSNINLTLLTILAKKHILDTWPGPQCPCADRCKTGLQIQTEISPRQQVKMSSFKGALMQI